MAGINGSVSGFFGLAASPLELSVTTTLMLREFADIARYHGEDLSSLEARLACIVVDNWDSATLVNRLELQVGKDLQYICINGTLVGGLVGVLIFKG